MTEAERTVTVAPPELTVSDVAIFVTPGMSASVKADEHGLPAVVIREALGRVTFQAADAGDLGLLGEFADRLAAAAAECASAARALCGTGESAR